MFKWIIGTILATALFLLGSIFLYVGAFKDVVIEESNKPELYLLAKTHHGAYHKIIDDLEEVEALVKAEGLKCEKTFGRFFDNPDSVDEDRLKSEVGCFFEGEPPLLTKEILQKFGETLELIKIEPQLYVQGKFDGAPSIGPMKVYPKIKDYLLEKGFSESGAPIEVYQMTKESGVTTTYLFPVKHSR